MFTNSPCLQQGDTCACLSHSPSRLGYSTSFQWENQFVQPGYLQDWVTDSLADNQQNQKTPCHSCCTAMMAFIKACATRCGCRYRFLHLASRLRWRCVIYSAVTGLLWPRESNAMPSHLSIKSTGSAIFSSVCCALRAILIGLFLANRLWSRCPLKPNITDQWMNEWI